VIRLTISTAEKRQGGLVDGKGQRVGWSVVQGGGGLILAYCDTEEEADMLVAFFVKHGMMEIAGHGAVPSALVPVER
jgi:hypothetical protein